LPLYSGCFEFGPAGQALFDLLRDGGGAGLCGGDLGGGALV